MRAIIQLLQSHFTAFFFLQLPAFRRDLCVYWSKIEEAGGGGCPSLKANSQSKMIKTVKTFYRKKRTLLFFVCLRSAISDHSDSVKCDQW
jgi:hypothetical protein